MPGFAINIFLINLTVQYRHEVFHDAAALLLGEQAEDKIAMPKAITLFFVEPPTALYQATIVMEYLFALQYLGVALLKGSSGAELLFLPKFNEEEEARRLQVTGLEDLDLCGTKVDPDTDDAAPLLDIINHFERNCAVLMCWLKFCKDGLPLEDAEKMYTSFKTVEVAPPEGFQVVSQGGMVCEEEEI